MLSVNGLKVAGENDIISGGEGSDCIMGERGTDCLAGDSGNDIITGGNGADTISGGPGVDAIIVLGSNDNITAGNFGTLNIADNAIDGVSCGAGADTVYNGPNENDVVDNDCETVYHPTLTWTYQRKLANQLNQYQISMFRHRVNQAVKSQEVLI
jgi:hypothetical protein